MTETIYEGRETVENCTHSINEPCRLHPVDCPTCENEATCGMKETMLAHPDKIKRCRSYRKRRRLETPPDVQATPDQSPKRTVVETMLDKWGPLHRDSGNH